MKCKYCLGSCIKFGKYKNGHQRFYCRSCRKCQKSLYIYKACELNLNDAIERHCNEGCGIRSISRLLEVSRGYVLSVVKRLYRSKIKNKKIIPFGREYELDEMRTYVGSKKRKYWIVYAIDRCTKEVVDFKVGKRTKTTLKKIVDTLLMAKAKKIYTDGLRSYKKLIPETIHKVGRYKINKIERNNLNVRTHLKRLSRRTIRFSKSISMLEATLGVYFWRNVYLGNSYGL